MRVRHLAQDRDQVRPARSRLSGWNSGLVARTRIDGPGPVILARQQALGQRAVGDY